MPRLIVFLVLTTGLLLVSRSSLKSPGSHGFYRFFAWECILAMVFLNFRSFHQWFRDPFSLRQLASWLLLLACLVPGVAGIHLLFTRGRPDKHRPVDVPLIGIEKTTRLVTTGVFGYIRHPLYCSLLLLAWGVFFKGISWQAGSLALGATIFLFATATAEERENLRYFGPSYEAYMQQTKMFIPYLL